MPWRLERRAGLASNWGATPNCTKSGETTQAPRISPARVPLQGKRTVPTCLAAVLAMGIDLKTRALCGNVCTLRVRHGSHAAIGLLVQKASAVQWARLIARPRTHRSHREDSDDDTCSVISNISYG